MYLLWLYFENKFRMAEIKMGVFILQMFGLGSYLWSFAVSFGDIRSLILFIVGLVFALYKVYNAHLDALKKKLISTTINKVKLEIGKN